mmetsp:Transcript_33922/g.51140  ORF Transcript_33922/g.51140 Transcript_33922/m.51140 type:complete len:193 (-) Transcript_33922:831-1409(-)
MSCEGLRHGKGKIKWSNGDTFDGTFRDGMRNGLGTLIYHDGTCVPLCMCMFYVTVYVCLLIRYVCMVYVCCQKSLSSHNLLCMFVLLFYEQYTCTNAQAPVTKVDGKTTYFTDMECKNSPMNTFTMGTLFMVHATAMVSVSLAMAIDTLEVGKTDSFMDTVNIIMQMVTCMKECLYKGCVMDLAENTHQMAN